MTPSASFLEIADDIKPCEGRLEIRSLDRKGNVTHIYKTPNVIVFDARIVQAHLLVGDLPNAYKLGFIAVGIGSTAPQRADQALIQEIHKQAIEAYTFPEDGQVEISATLDFSSPANNNTLREAGLVCANGSTLYARQVHGNIYKDSGIQLQYIWRIIYT